MKKDLLREYAFVASFPRVLLIRKLLESLDDYVNCPEDNKEKEKLWKKVVFSCAIILMNDVSNGGKNLEDTIKEIESMDNVAKMIRLMKQ